MSQKIKPRDARQSTPCVPAPEPLAQPGEVVELRPMDAAFGTHQKSLLLKTDDVQIIQQFLPAGGEIPTFEAQGQSIFHCLKGHVSLTALGGPHELHSGQLLYLQASDPFSILADEASSLLIIIIGAKHGDKVVLIGE